MNLEKNIAARILEYLDRCPLGGPGSAGMHKERIEMNYITDVLVGIINYEPPAEEDPPTATEENPDERTEDETSGET